MISQLDLECLITTKNKIDAKLSGLKWFLFGSASTRQATASDIDLLVVCKNDDDADRIRNMIIKSEIYPLIDLTIMTEDEEIFTSFIKNQKCKII